MDWHNDTNAAASSFYGRCGRRGKAMTGKASHTALLRGKHSKFAAKWSKLFEGRYIKDFVRRWNRQPTVDEVKDAVATGLRIAIDSGTVSKDIERWTDTGCVLSIRHGTTCHCNLCRKYPLSDMTAAAASMGAFVEASKAAAEQRRLGKLATEKAERDAREHTLKLMRIRENPSIPEQVMGRLLNNLVTTEHVLMCFQVTDDVLADHKEAFKHLVGATD